MDTDAGDLRDIFALLYDGDDWSFESDTEQDSHQDESRAEQPDAINGASRGADIPVEEGVTIAREGTVEKVEEAVSYMAGNRERYTRKRFTDELDSLLYPSPKRSRIYTTRPSPVSYYTSCTPLPPLPSLRTYTPFSPLALLARLRTFDPFSYSSSIPSPLTARQVALAGWTAGPGNNCVHCALCGGGWDLSGVSEILDEATRKEVASRLEGAKITKHRKGCAWKITQSPDELYGQMRRMLHPPTVGSLGPLQAALRGQCEDLGRIRWTAPIDHRTAQTLAGNLARSGPSSTRTPSTPPHDLAVTAAALALFAWYPYHPNGSSTHVAHADSADTSIADPAHHTPTAQTSIVQCRLCERRVGLWSFLPTSSPASSTSEGEGDKMFDLAEEHLDWCPIKCDSASAAPMTTTVTGWWSDLSILSPPGKTSTTTTTAGTAPTPEKKEDWLKVSDKLAQRPWRRKRGSVRADTQVA